ncbi:Spermidine/putrescine import ATP-binding protein PotA [Actinomadura rubteroloni]|uniref:Spermidine/putrescine import ATP-binding protein PotA n=1 Tax=Actinomadura rubteroloni TaxID=1926885 RepID=A0A2P4ULS1_9ACTN|nr:ABC transporter ATP-binding protein [Actinomadura rubteroloni]POM25949.1 Spermidine/putrescine import ATP-binding protein PotA [Actinomadura rubteroloni]
MTSAQPPAVELAGVAKTYRSGTAAVRGLDLTILAGEFFSLLGPSGCGKTTTLRLIAGFEEPTAGEVRLHGTRVTGVPAHRRDVNTVFQSYALFPHLSVFENVAFGLRRRRVPRGEIAARVGAMLETVELTGLERRRPGELSGGQQQRVALARALVNRPRALLLDEPLGALDLRLRQAMQVSLKRIQREVGLTFVYVTHDQGEALTMSDRVAVLNDGRIEQVGTPREVYERPATRFAASFVGTSNLLAGEVAAVAAGRAVVVHGADGRIEVPVRDAVGVGQLLELAVRPEKISLGRTRPGGGLCGVRGTVTEVVYLGTATNYNVTTSAGADVVVFRQNAASADEVAGRGDEVWLSWEPDHSYALGAVR